MKSKISVIVPCYKGSKTIFKVIKKIPTYVSKIYIVDDKCPEKTGYIVKKKFKNNNKIKVIFKNKNSGVGSAMKEGYYRSIRDKMDISVKIDSDGQMDPGLIKYFINPLINQNYDYTKGNRFGSLKNLFLMPLKRTLGNIFFSLLAKITTKNFDIFDFHNGYIAIKNTALKKINYKSLDNTYFFETHLLYKLKKKKLKIKQINMSPVYHNEKSSLKEFKIGFMFLKKHIKLFFGLNIN